MNPAGAHDQDDAIGEKISHYERALSDADLPNIPFHSAPLLNGYKDYENLKPEQRKRLLVAFNVLVQRLPIRYKTFGCYMGRCFPPSTENKSSEQLSAKYPNAIPQYEFKLGESEVAQGAEHLCEVERLVKEHNAAEKQCPIPLPTLKLVITGAAYGYRRDNGVLVIPIGCLRD